MKVLLSLALFVSLATVMVHGYVWLQQVEEDPSHPNKCIYRDTVFDIGAEIQHPDTCGRIICSVFEHLDGLVMEGQHCGVVSLGDLPEGKCLVDSNPDADYPKCCQKEIGDCPVP